MTDNRALQAHAQIVSASAQLFASISAMNAANQERLSCGASIAYDESAFMQEVYQFQQAFGWNAICEMFDRS